MAADDVRDALARAFSDPGSITPRQEGETVTQWSARAALPVVDRIAREAAGKALESVVDEAQQAGAYSVPLWHLLNRARAEAADGGGDRG